MELSDCAKILYGRLHKLEPENAHRIVGYILLTHTHQEVIDCANGPDSQIHALNNEAKQCLVSCGILEDETVNKDHASGFASLWDQGHIWYIISRKGVPIPEGRPFQPDKNQWHVNELHSWSWYVLENSLDKPNHGTIFLLCFFVDKNHFCRFIYLFYKCGDVMMGLKLISQPIYILIMRDLLFMWMN